MIITRRFYKVLSDRLAEEAPLIQILIGARQVGKTTASRRIYDEWVGPKLYATADSPSPPKAEWIRWQWENALRLGKGALLIIDEVQKIEGWGEQIKLLFDPVRGTGDIKILLLGSSSLGMKRGLDESLAGRFELIHAPHWTFGEFKEAFDWDLTRYIKFGAYPGAAEYAADEERWREYILHSIIESVLGRDILGQRPVHKPALLRQTFELAARHPAHVISLQKMLGQLQEGGNVTTIKEYLDIFRQAFMFTPLQKFSGSIIQTKSSSPKIVVLNQAITNSYCMSRRLDEDPGWFGFVFESIVGAHLLQVPHSELYYWRMGNSEVDYVLSIDGEMLAIEIKSGITVKRGGLDAFSKRYPKACCEAWNFDRCAKFLEDGVL